MGQFRDVICSQCGRTENYFHKRGPLRKKCFKCSPRKDKPKRRSLNAYRLNFTGVDLPHPWRVTHSGTGNICRWIGSTLITLFDHHGRYAVSMNMSGHAKFRSSRIQASLENLDKATDWAENMAQATEKYYQL